LDINVISEQNKHERLILEVMIVTLQNEHEVREMLKGLQQIQEDVRNAQNSADTQQIQKAQKGIQELQSQVLDAQGKATKGNDQSNVELFEAQQQLEQYQQEMERAERNIEAQRNEVQ